MAVTPVPAAPPASHPPRRELHLMNLTRHLVPPCCPIPTPAPAAWLLGKPAAGVFHRQRTLGLTVSTSPLPSGPLKPWEQGGLVPAVRGPGGLRISRCLVPRRRPRSRTLSCSVTDGGDRLEAALVQVGDIVAEADGMTLRRGWQRRMTRSSPPPGPRCGRHRRRAGDRTRRPHAGRERRDGHHRRTQGTGTPEGRGDAAGRGRHR
jgi:hypothetical protein